VPDGNGQRRPPRPQIQVAAANASPEEAAAIAAGLEQFLAEHAPAPAAEPVSAWQRTALREGTERAPRADVWGSAPRL
jgi:hypothetical protein